jgi:peptidoglycan hydrolase-like protein with peptidoglycan-binding domain
MSSLAIHHDHASDRDQDRTDRPTTRPPEPSRSDAVPVSGLVGAPTAGAPVDGATSAAGRWLLDWSGAGETTQTSVLESGNGATASAATTPIRRAPADFAGTTVTTLKSGWGLLLVGSTPWDKIKEAVRGYAALRDDQYDERVTFLGRLPALITAWERHHKVGTAQLNADERAKVAALQTLRTLIEAEHRQLVTAGATVNERTQSIQASRFKGDYLLEQVFRGGATLSRGDNGLSVTKIQQALADTSHLSQGSVNGAFNAATETGVQSFQRAEGLPEDGVVDRPTMVKLEGVFRQHGVERTLAQAPAVGAKGAAGEFVWGTAPAELTADTRDLAVSEAAAAKQVVKTSQGVQAGGVLPTFVPNLPGRGAYEARLKALVLELVQQEYDHLAAGKAARRGPGHLFGWDHIRDVAARSKAATDAVFGKWAIGPPLAPGAGIHDAWDTKVTVLADPDAREAAANWRVEKLLTGHPRVAALDQQHGAIQSRGPEKAIVDRVKAEIVAARRDDLLEIHKAWPAFASDGEVNIQRFRETTNEANREAMWHLFQTVVHEYLHTLEHSRHVTYRNTLEQQAGAFTLREGVVEYLTYTVLESITYDDALRTLVEGEFHEDAVRHQIPNYRGYGERANAEKLAGVVGTRNVMAAFFLGDVEKIGGTG